MSAKKDPMLPLTGLAILCGGLSLILKEHAWLKLYPVGMSLGALLIFALTLYKPPSMIERFARLVEPDLPESGVQWTRKVTMVWLGGEFVDCFGVGVEFDVGLDVSSLLVMEFIPRAICLGQWAVSGLGYCSAHEC